MTAAQVSTVRRLLEGVEGEVMHGSCVGADDEFDRIAVGLGRFRWLYPAKGVEPRFVAPCALRSPNWCYSFAPDEPLVRNHHIVDDSDLLIAAPARMDEVRRGSGTWATIRYARKVGRPMAIIGPVGAGPIDFVYDGRVATRSEWLPWDPDISVPGTKE